MKINHHFLLLLMFLILPMFVFAQFTGSVGQNISINIDLAEAGGLQILWLLREQFLAYYRICCLASGNFRHIRDYRFVISVLSILSQPMMTQSAERKPP